MFGNRASPQRWQVPLVLCGRGYNYSWIYLQRVVTNAAELSRPMQWQIITTKEKHLKLATGDQFLRCTPQYDELGIHEEVQETWKQPLATIRNGAKDRQQFIPESWVAHLRNG